MTSTTTDDSTTASKNVMVATRVPEEVRARLKEIAYNKSSPQTTVPVSAVLRAAIDEYLDDMEVVIE